jgi:hypothetical protein
VGGGDFSGYWVAGGMYVWLFLITYCIGADAKALGRIRNNSFGTDPGNLVYNWCLHFPIS